MTKMNIMSARLEKLYDYTLIRVCVVFDTNSRKEIKSNVPAAYSP